MSSVWTIEITRTASKQLAKLDRHVSKRIRSYLQERIAEEDPLRAAKWLQGPFNSFWAYRVGDHRILCEVHDGRLVILILKIEHRSAVYRR